MISNQAVSSQRYLSIRHQSEKLCDPLETEDYVAQPVVDVSPPRWHLAHTTWFFENFLLIPYVKGYKLFHPKYHYLFNSYYVQAGERWQRAERGYLTRPTVKEIFAYRKYIDEQMQGLVEGQDLSNEISQIIELGLQHEQQHQELLLYDIKFILGNNPLYPVYKFLKTSPVYGQNNDWFHIPSGNYSIGYEGEGFHFDNEKGRHTVYLHDFEIAKSVVTKGEFLEFIEQGGYDNAPLWLDEGAKWVAENKVNSPMYWVKEDQSWMEYTLGGLVPVDWNDPVSHISFYEADAYARWKGCRLPTEEEWEVACRQYGDHSTPSANFMESERYQPVQTEESGFLGNVWEWTSSPYRPYPFYKAASGAIGEYNGKFMINQMVLRGGSYGTSRDHIRITYRNFFHPHLRWMFSGIRLARHI